MPRVSLLTPTCDRPVAFALCERWMRAQTRGWHEWIVADSGQTPATLTLGQTHLHEPAPPGAANFRRNLQRGLEAVTGEIVVIIEDDDHYAPTHLAQMVQPFLDHPVSIVGDPEQRYYNVQRRCWRVFKNIGASLCQTAIDRTVIPAFQHAIAIAGRRQFGYGVDAVLWAAVPQRLQFLARMDTVVGIKGLPGAPGLGIGHRPSGPQWRADPTGQQLLDWIGADAEAYFALH